MKLISPTNKKHIRYVHIYKSLDGWGYNLQPYPPSNKTTLQNWQIKAIMLALQEEALTLNMLLQHS